MFLLSPKTLSNIWASFVKQWSPLLLKIAQSGHIGIQRVERFICKQNNYKHLKMLRKEVSFSSLKRQNLLLSDGYAQDLKVHDIKLTNVFAQKSVFISPLTDLLSKIYPKANSFFVKKSFSFFDTATTIMMLFVVNSIHVYLTMRIF